MIDYIETYGERLGGFLNWFEANTEFEDWAPTIKKEVIEKLDHAWTMHLAETVNEKKKLEIIIKEIKRSLKI